jgi:L-amino acid N-acyltransferase
VKIRDADASDLASILDIYNDAIEHTTAVFDYTPHTLDARRQ